VQGQESKGVTLDLKLLRTNGLKLTSASSRSSPLVASVFSVVVVEDFGLASMFAYCPHLTRLGMDWHLCSRKRDIALCLHPVFRPGLRVVVAVCGWRYLVRHEGFGWVRAGQATNSSRTRRSCGWRFFDA
jgi:hypothetical protein